MDPVKEKKLGVNINLVIMLVFLIFGFCYPDLFRDKLDELLWFGDGVGDIILFGLIGTIIFVLAGCAATGVIKYSANGKLKGSSITSIEIDFWVFGASYMTLRIMSVIENYGIIGRAAIEQNNLQMIKPISIIILIVTVVAIIVELYKIYSNYPGISDGGSVSFGDKLSKTLLHTEKDTRKTEDETEKTHFGEMNFSDEEKAIVDGFGEDHSFAGETGEYVEENAKTEITETPEKDEAPKSRIKSTMIVSTANTTGEKSDRINTAGDL